MNPKKHHRNSKNGCINIAFSNTGLLSVEWQKFSEPRLGDNVDEEEDILDEYQYDSAEDVEDPDYDELKIAEVEVDEKEDKAKKV